MNLGIALDLVDSLLVYIVWCYFATRMLPMGRKGLFWIVSGALSFLGDGMGYLYLLVLPDAQMPLALGTGVLAVVETVVVPLVFWKAPLLSRIVGVCALNLCDGLAGAVQAMLFEPIFGTSVPEAFLDEVALWEASPLAWAVSELFYALVLMSLMTLATRLVRRGRVLSGTASGPLGLLMLSQLALAAACLFSIARSVGTVWYAAMAALLCLSVAVVAAGAVTADRCADREQARRERLVQESRLAGFAASQRESQAVIKQIAVLRHDARNEIAAALRMAAQGESDRAAAVLSEMALRCEKASGSAGKEAQR